MFKELFTIEYNNKRFLILVSDKHRKTFLEVTKDGKYTYPLYEDFKELDKIYNSDSRILYSIKKYNYVEKVRYKATVLLLSTVLASFLGKELVSQKEEVQEPVLSYVNMYNSNTSLDIDSYFANESVTREMVIDAINSNENLSDNHKEIAVKALDNILELDPNANLRIYYENMKTIKVISLTEKEIRKMFNEYIDGCYSIEDNIIYVSDNMEKYVLYHEFTHAFHNLFIRDKEQSIAAYETGAHSFEEAMTNIIVFNKWDEVKGEFTNGLPPYYQEVNVVKFLMSSTDSFDYHIYNELGVTALINELKTKFTSVDIDFIVDYLDTLMKTDLNFGTPMLLRNQKPLVEELFKIAVNNIDIDNPYDSFKNFIKVFNVSSYSDFYEEYFMQYTDVLFERFMNNVNKDNVLEMFSSFMSEINSDNYGKCFLRYGNRLVEDGLISKESFDELNDVRESLGNNLSLLYNDGRFYFCNTLINGIVYYDNGEKVSVDKLPNYENSLLIWINNDALVKMYSDSIIYGKEVYSNDYLNRLFASGILFDEEFKSFINDLPVEKRTEIESALSETQYGEVGLENNFQMHQK